MSTSEPDAVENNPITWPTHWSEEACAAAEVVLHALPDLCGAAWAALMSVGELLTVAAAHERIARGADYLATGAAGHLVTHPAAVEARLARTSANATLVRLVAPDDGLSKSRAGSPRRTLAGARDGRPSSPGGYAGPRPGYESRPRSPSRRAAKPSTFSRTTGRRRPSW